MLELAWAAVEDARIVPVPSTGVFVAAASDDYATLLDRAGADAVTRHSMAGVRRGLIANRRLLRARPARAECRGR